MQERPRNFCDKLVASSELKWIVLLQKLSLSTCKTKDLWRWIGWFASTVFPGSRKKGAPLLFLQSSAKIVIFAPKGYLSPYPAPSLIARVQLPLPNDHTRLLSLFSWKLHYYQTFCPTLTILAVRCKKGGRLNSIPILMPAVPSAFHLTSTSNVSTRRRPLHPCLRPTFASGVGAWYMLWIDFRCGHLNSCSREWKAVVTTQRGNSKSSRRGTRHYIRKTGQTLGIRWWSSLSLLSYRNCVVVRKVVLAEGSWEVWWGSGWKVSQVGKSTFPIEWSVRELTPRLRNRATRGGSPFAQVGLSKVLDILGGCLCVRLFMVHCNNAPE